MPTRMRRPATSGARASAKTSGPSGVWPPHLDADLRARRHPVRVGELRAHVHVDAGGVQVREVALGGPRQQVVRHLDGHPELRLVVAGPDVGVGVDVDVGVDAHGEAAAPAEPGSDRLERLQLVGRLDVHEHAVLHGQGQLLGGLADAGEDRAGRVAAGAQHAQQLAAADHVEAGAAAGQARQHGEVGVRLDGIQRFAAERLEGAGDAPPCGGDRVEVVDVGGRAGGGDHLVERQPTHVQDAVLVGEGLLVGAPGEPLLVHQAAKAGVRGRRGRPAGRSGVPWPPRSSS